MNVVKRSRSSAFGRCANRSNQISSLAGALSQWKYRSATRIREPR
ncbi:MAG TPA: hypothetical protein VGQ26_02980 [Streptosporangiaceae bacterium]|nr:hypothetical protein [Streptosporangiaceae bacterium]